MATGAVEAADAKAGEPRRRVVYDSDAPGDGVLDLAGDLWAWRPLVLLLVERDLVSRYKRSVLGVWWTLLNPLLLAATLYIVFESFLGARLPDTPYLVYVLSGLAIAELMRTGVLHVGNSIVASAALLRRMRVPAGAFAAGSLGAVGVTFVIYLLPLGVAQLLTGAGIRWTFPLTVVPALGCLAFAGGIGLLVASLAVRYPDMLNVTDVLVQLAVWFSPTFYPESIVPEGSRWVFDVNPIAQALELVRSLAYEGDTGDPLAWAIVMGGGALTFAAGSMVFSRSWRRAAVEA